MALKGSVQRMETDISAAEQSLLAMQRCGRFRLSPSLWLSDFSPTQRLSHLTSHLAEWTRRAKEPAA